ncbi:SprT family zinc-dependent metalloprotease [soil metagenome]
MPPSTVPPQALVQTPPSPDFRHPAATNELQLLGREVAYLLRRARRRSIGMVVTPDGLRVSAPRWVAVRDIEDALREKAAWIVAKLAEQRARAAKAVAAKVDWRSGASLPFLGGNLTVVLGRGGVRSVALVDVGGAHELHLGLPEDAAPDRIARAVRTWLKLEALKVFEARCRLYMAGMGVSFSRLALTSAKTRWGSASSSDAIRLHWRLVHFGLPTIDYVVVHELAHLREMNHSPRFWAIVASVLPDYESSRNELKTRVLPVID